MEQKYKLLDLVDALNDTLNMLEQLGFPYQSSLDFTIIVRPKLGKPVLVVEFPTVKV